MPSRPDAKFFTFDAANGRISVVGRSFNLPRSRAARITIGCLFIVGGIFSFLPVLGIWMLPLGLLILSQDLPVVRRWRRRTSVWITRWRRKES